MKIDYRNIKLLLKPALSLMGKRHASRHGILIRLQGKKHTAYGEANPLPGLHKETIDDVHKQLVAIQGRVKEWREPLSFNETEGLLKQLEEKEALVPSLRFALEAALLQLAASNCETIPSLLLNTTAADKIEINGLLAGEGGKEADVLKQMLQSGCRTIKVKVGRAGVDEEIALIKHLNSLLPNNARLRLDANQAWNIKEARRFMDGIGECNVEYLEEPLQDPAELHQFKEKTPIPLALDESLISVTPVDLNIPQNVVALVLKPAVLGGATPISLWAKRAYQTGADVVISGSFCSSVGLIAEAGIAAAFSKSAAGLGTWRWISEDVLTDRFAPEEYSVSTSTAFAKLQTVPKTLFPEE